MRSLIYAWINGWLNNGGAGYWRRHRAHYAVMVMEHDYIYLNVISKQQKMPVFNLCDIELCWDYLTNWNHRCCRSGWVCYFVVNWYQEMQDTTTIIMLRVCCHVCMTVYLWSDICDRVVFQKCLRALLNLGTLKIATLYKYCIFQCMGQIFCVEFQRYPLKCHSKYLTPYIERCVLYSQVKIWELLDLRAHTRFWNKCPRTSVHVKWHCYKY